MAIKKTKSNQDKIILEIDNGDLEAINDIIKKHDFKDEQALIRFSLISLLRADNPIISIEENGKKITLAPSETLIKKGSKNSDSTEVVENGEN